MLGNSSFGARRQDKRAWQLEDFMPRRVAKQRKQMPLDDQIRFFQMLSALTSPPDPKEP